MQMSHLAVPVLWRITNREVKMFKYHTGKTLSNKDVLANMGTMAGNLSTFPIRQGTKNFHFRRLTELVI